MVSLPEDDNHRKSLANIGFKISDYTITDKTPIQIKEFLATFEAICISAGNVFYLLQQVQLTGFTEIIRDLIINQNKIYIGSSAGSVIAGPDILPVKGLDDISFAPKINGFKGFNLVDFLSYPREEKVEREG